MRSPILGKGALLAAGIAATVGVAGSGAALAQKAVSLTAVDGYPPKALQVRMFLDHFIPEVDRRLAQTGRYKVNWNKAFAGQIVKVRHVLTGMQKGLGDIGVVTSVFHQDKVPMQAVAYVTPFVTTDAVLLSRTVDGLAEKYPEMKKAWERYNQVLLTSFSVIDSYQMFFRDRITRLEQFDGLKIAGAGINMRYLTGTGATPVIGSMVHYYNKFKTGVIDGSMLWTDAVVAFKLVEEAKFMLKADIGAVNSKALTMNRDAYRRLPGEVREVIHAVSADYRDRTAARALSDADKAYRNFRGKGGEVVQMSRAARERWAQTMPNIAKEWAGQLDAKGLPGTGLLRTYMDRMRAADQPIIRHWDKE